MQDRLPFSSKKRTPIKAQSGWSLGIVKVMNITIIADGADEAEAVEGLAALIDTGFTE